MRDFLLNELASGPKTLSYLRGLCGPDTATMVVEMVGNGEVVIKPGCIVTLVPQWATFQSRATVEAIFIDENLLAAQSKFAEVNIIYHKAYLEFAQGGIYHKAKPGTWLYRYKKAGSLLYTTLPDGDFQSQYQ